MPRWARPPLCAIALALTYAGIYELIIRGSSFGTSVGATFWPASGVTVAVLILRPRREWPAYLAAIWVADFVMDTHGGGYGAAASLGIAAANCAEPLLSASLLRRWLRDPPDLSNVRELGLFYLAAAGCGPALSATIASGWQWVLSSHAVWPYGGRWYVGDALGVIVIAPALLSAARDRTRPTLIQAAMIVATVIAAGAVLAAPFAARDGLPFLVIPALSLIAIRLGTRGGAAALGIGVIVEVLTVVGSGAFAGDGPFTGLLSAQMYVVACSVSGLTAAALMAGLISRDRLALHDSLTGLANRRLLMNRTSMSLGHLGRSREALGLVFIDLDGFKAINDAHGHQVGDLVLIEVGHRLQETVREADTIARIGGDEFVILIDRAAVPATMAALAHRLERIIAEPIPIAGTEVQVRASVGYTICDRHDARPEEVLRYADDAMYQVKRGRADPDVDPLPA